MKLNPEIFDHAAAEDMSADALLTHLQGQAWLFRVEHEDCLIPKRLLPGALPFTEDRDSAVAELVSRDWWVEHPRAFEVVYDASTIVQSLHAQWAKRKKDQRAQAKARSKRTSTDDAPDDTTAEAAPPQPTNQANYREDEELDSASVDPFCAYCGVSSPARLLSESGIHRYGCSRQEAA